jgi:hypothetical protein
MNLSIVLRDKRFLGVRIGVAGFVLAAIGFMLAILGMRNFGLVLFGIAWIIVVTGFLLYIAGRRRS